jgi:phosphatidylglycerol:prolipoprotein diacylglycerol transferase
MKPILFHIGSWPIRNYGIALAIAFVAGILLGRRRARAAGLDPDLIVDLAFYVIIASIAGARATYAVVHWEYFQHDLIGVLRLWDGGLAQYGGIAAGVVTGLIFFARRGVSPWRGADIMAPSVALGVSIGRIGCFLNGCCFGKPCDLPWAVTFPAGSIAAHEFPGVALHPTQIYESLAALAICGILLVAEKRKPFDGFLLWVMLLLLAVSRFAVDPLRCYEPTSMVGGALTTNQIIGIALAGTATAALVILAVRRRRARPGGSRQD